ncbi:MAG TPA: 2,5-didehydrogluconate reductase [Anaerolineae bacterium]|nr:2,5-didehydrogluconate reductase [Anaerolineae bacterium]
MGLGAWQWGDHVVWQYGNEYGAKEIQEAFEASIKEGVRFVDTAEVYGRGGSERFLGKFIKDTDQPVLVATKFFPYPWRLRSRNLPNALKGSLERIGVEGVDLYQIHWPTPLMSVDTMMDGMIECVKSGMTRTVGVSNFNQTRMLAAYSALARQNIPLASNQVHYSLLNRKVEKDGTLARCKELGVRLIAYSPLEQGLLTGKYDMRNRPSGSRSGSLAGILPKIEPLIKLMTTIGQDHGGKANAQVALNWTICKGTLPIPGAKNVAQAQENAGALGWKLTDDEVAKLDELSDQIMK